MFVACTNHSCSQNGIAKQVMTGPDGELPPGFAVEEVVCGQCGQTEMQEVPEPKEATT